MKKALILFGIILLIGVLFYVYQKSQNQTGTSATLLQFIDNQNITAWSNPEKTSEKINGTTVSGTKIEATVSGQITDFMNFENKDILEKQGFVRDNSLAADGPGASTWGYKRSDDDRTQFVLFSYSTKPTNNNPNEPLEFDCPCEIMLSVFLSKPFENVIEKNIPQLANPASINCEKVGGTLSIQTLGNGAQYGLCNFEDNMSCEEWALFRGECPVGGVKTTGYDNTGQMYCAWLGGETLAIPNSQCSLPDGTVCSTDALYAGTCPSYTN